MSFSAEFCERAKISAGGRFDLLLGTGGDRALLRLARNDKEGIVVAAAIGRGGLSFNLGHIARFGMDGQEGEYCEAVLVDTDTIDVVLPEWADEQAEA